MLDQAPAQDSPLDTPVDAAALTADAELRAILSGAAAVAIWDADGGSPVWRNRAALAHPALRGQALAAPLRTIARRVGARETISLERLRYFEGPRAVGLTLAVRSVQLTDGRRGLLTAVPAPQDRTSGPGRQDTPAEPPAPAATPPPPVHSPEAPAAIVAAPAPAEAGGTEKIARTRRVRLVWRTDADGLLVHLSGPGAEALAGGDADAPPLAELLGTGGLRLRGPMAERRTFTSLPAAWPLHDGGVAPCRISGAPILDEQRMFRGFSGFALIEMPLDTARPARTPGEAAPMQPAPGMAAGDLAPARQDGAAPAAQPFPGWSFGAIAAQATFSGAPLGGIMAPPAWEAGDEAQTHVADATEEAEDTLEPLDMGGKDGLTAEQRSWWMEESETQPAEIGDGDESGQDGEDAPDDAPQPFSLGWSGPGSLSALLDSIGAVPTPPQGEESEADLGEDEAEDEGETDGEDDGLSEDVFDGDLWDEDEDEDEAAAETEAGAGDELWDEDEGEHDEDEDDESGDDSDEAEAEADDGLWTAAAHEPEEETEAATGGDDDIFGEGPAAAAGADAEPAAERAETGGDGLADEAEAVEPPAGAVVPAADDTAAPDQVRTTPEEDEAAAAEDQERRPGGKVVALRGSTEVTPFTLAAQKPAGDGLSVTERNAFREIAKALGARLEGEAAGQDPAAAAAPAPDAPARGTHDAAPLATAVPAAASREAGQPAVAVSPWAGQAEALIEKLPVGVMVMRGQVPIAMNRTLLDLVGYPDIDSFYEDGGVARLFQGAGERAASGTIAVQTREGELIEVDARMQAIDWQGDPATLVSFRRSAEAEMRPKLDTLEMELSATQARRRELEAVLDTATDGVVLVDDLGRVLSLNRSAEALFGYDQREVAGEPFSVLLAPDSHVAATDYLEGLKSGGVKSVLNDGREVFGRERNGGRIPLFLTIGVVSEGAQRKFCAVLRDMTAWKSAEAELVEARRAAEHASAQKSDFLAKISHEIRTPLSAIIGFAEVMMEERFGPVGNERYREYLRDIHSSGTHVVSLVNDLLDLSKIEAGRMELEFKSVQLNDIVTAGVALMQPQAGQARVIVRTSLARKLPPVVADERSLRQIVLNILSNAVKFTDPGGQIIVSTAYTDRGEVTLRVRDTGIGMNEKDLALALEPFRQVATTRRTTGTGLGLPLTKALVEANRAQFTISSVKDEGTLVEITFPATRVLAD